MKNLLLPVLWLLLSLQPAHAQVTVSNSPTQIVVSRTSGVAPLLVFFDTITASDDNTASQAFHQLEYRWIFGDTESAWQRGARAGSSSRNTTAGPLAAHVYERPGNYVATVKIFDGNNMVVRQVSISVSDPNSVFSGSNTVCFSTGARGFSGCPAGARQVTTSDFAAAINGNKAPNRRLLFRRGETFRSGSTAIIDVNGPGIVGAFGPSADPLPVLQSTANTTTIQMSNYRTPGIRDWRLMDLQLVGSKGTASYGVGFVGGINQVTLLRLSTQQQRLAVIAEMKGLDSLNSGGGSNSGHKIWDQIGIVDSTISSINHSSSDAGKGYGVYLCGERVFFAGNWIDNVGTASADVSHVTRFPYLGKAVISNNTLMRPGPTEHVIKLHGPPWTGRGVAYNGIGRGYTRWVEIADNKLVGANNAWAVAVGPQNSSYDERVRDVVFERNWLVAGPGLQVGLIAWASAVTSRGNIFDLSAGANSQAGIGIARRGVEPYPSVIRIYNDTFYSSKATSNGQFAGFSLGSGVSNVVAKNNLAYAPKATNPLMFRNGCGNCLSASNNSSNNQVKYNLPFAAGSPSTPAQFRSANYAVGAGTAVPTWMDFSLTAAGWPRTMGAVTK